MRWIPILLLAALTARAQEKDMTAEAERVRQAGELIGLDFTDKELELMVRSAVSNVRRYKLLRDAGVGNAVGPATTFTPFLAGMKARPSGLEATELKLPDVERPDNLEDLAFADIATLASLIKSRKVSCVELTRMFLARLKRLDKTLHCVITFTDERALKQAEGLDKELAAGKWRGPLHGIPYGAKDLFSAKGYKTTWGAAPFKDQVIDEDAAVLSKLDQAGAVLIAKTTLGALAMGDVWYGERTRNPWNPEKGSSGSSAGSASATAAGGMAFSLGTETYGSIVSPATNCGCSALRPTFGRVSRKGAMALSWSMDKVGPICRSAADAALVFAALHDGAHPFAVNLGADVKGWRVGYFKRAAERMAPYAKVIEELKQLGVTLVEARLPRYPVQAMRIIISAEAAAAFDEITRDGRDDQLVRQTRGAWPNIFRVARLIPAVEYIQAQRLRAKMMRDVDKAFADFHFLVHPSYLGNLMLMFNLTGHPTAVAPSGFRRNGMPSSISFSARLLWDDRLLALVQAWQARTEHHKQHPRMR